MTVTSETQSHRAHLHVHMLLAAVTVSRYADHGVTRYLLLRSRFEKHFKFSCSAIVYLVDFALNKATGAPCMGDGAFHMFPIVRRAQLCFHSILGNL
jgi:hypothetical protein